jgi:hypothetical protein
MPKRYLSLLLAVGLIFASGAIAAAHHPEGPGSHGWDDYDPVDGPRAHEEDKGQHGEPGGHLPPSSQNVELVGVEELTNVSGGIADVGYYKGYAYLNAFAPECAGRTGAQGTGVHVVDVSNPNNPNKVAFLPSEPNSYQGEGIHVVTLNGRDLLVNNNETCDATLPVVSGFSVWDVTNPTAATKLGQFGDTTPPVPNQTFHTTHSVQAFTWQGKAYAVAQDNQDLKDVDIFDITPTLSGGPAVLVAERGLEDWPGAQGSYANGDTVFHHDMQQKVIGGHNFLAVSYWDAGQVLLNIDNPASPVFVTDSDYSSPDPEQPAFEIPEGNSHQSYFDQDGEWLLSTDEDFSPTRTLCRIASGPNEGDTGCGEFGFTPDLGDLYPAGFEGPTTFGGLGCEPGSVPPATGPGQILVVSRGTCFFSIKIENGQNAGYDLVAVGQSHGGTRNGLLPDAFLCGSAGHDYDEQIPAVCIGHRAMHQLFNSPPNYVGPEGADIPIGAPGEDLFAKGGVFDGWGYVHLHRNTTNLPVVDTYAVAEGQNPAFAEGFGNLTVHEVKTDPRTGKDLAYFSYYDAGLRVAKFGPGGITEVGHYIAEGGNDFWGVYPACTGGCADASPRGQQSGKGKGLRPLLLMSDRDSGLWIFRYTGQE